MVLIGILVKMIATVRAAHTLAAAGDALEVSIVVRSALEALITATFIAKTDSPLRAKRWLQYAVIIKAKMLAKPPGLSNTSAHKAARRRILARASSLKKKVLPNDRFWASGLKKNNLRDLATDVGLLWYYDVVHWLGSQGTHASPIAVERYLGTSTTGPSYKLVLSVENLRAELAVCCDLLQ